MKNFLSVMSLLLLALVPSEAKAEPFSAAGGDIKAYRGTGT
jgi:hypothetical protein